MGGQIVLLFRCFHTLGDYPQFEFAREFDDAVEYVAGQGVNPNHGHEALVDLQIVDIELA